MSPAGFLVCSLALPSPRSLGSSGSFSEHAVERYVSHFGPLNRVAQITPKYRLIIVDAPSLVDEDEERTKHGVPINNWPSVGGPVEFIKELSKPPGETDKWRLCHDRLILSWLFLGQEDVHNILLTHIPLYRPPGMSCGPIRERGTIRAGRGNGYQNTLSSEMSEFLIERIRPALVFRYARADGVFAPQDRYLTLPIAAMITTIANCNTKAASERSPSSRFPWLWGFENPGSSCCLCQRVTGTAPARSISCACCLTRLGSI